MITDEAVAVAEHEGKTDGVEENAAKAGVDHAFHQHVDGFARATEAGFQHREPDLHAEDEEGSDQVQAVLTGLTTSAAFTSGVPRLGIHMGKEERRRRRP